jgi:seryl-tRNA synthetase
MIDLRRLRDEPEYRRGIERKRVRAGLIDEVLSVDEQHRRANTAVQELRAAQNAASKEIGRASADERPARIEAASALKAQLAEQETALDALADQLHELVLQVPNPAHESVPDGGEDDGDVVRLVGGPLRTADELPHDHAAYGRRQGWVERDVAAEMSGSRFSYLMGEAVLLEFALVQWVMNKLVEQGFTPVVPPVLVREQAMIEAGFFPTDRHQVYEVDGGELFLVGTAEVPLSLIHRDSILDADQLPVRYAGFSSCFRREAGTAGKDTHGIFRVHQFDKVEMFVFADPASSWDEHERMLATEESIIGGLGLPYRVVNIAAGDLGNPAAKKYDIEVWMPSEGRYRELTSCSNYLDYSARRLKTRVRAEAGNQPVHTLNGTACAVARTLTFLFEHYQEPDGGFRVPEVLQPYCGFGRVEARG